MSVLSIGCDFVEIARIQALLRRYGAAFLGRVFTEVERQYALQYPDPAPFLAARFAAKEAVAKVFKVGIGAALGWRSISVAKGPKGDPVVLLDHQGQALLEAAGASRIELSLSHTRQLAQAVAILCA